MLMQYTKPITTYTRIQIIADNKMYVTISLYLIQNSIYSQATKIHAANTMEMVCSHNMEYAASCINTKSMMHVI
jgi:hypothetical protein